MRHEDDPEAIVRGSRGGRGVLLMLALVVGVVLVIGLTQLHAQPQRQLALATVERMRTGQGAAGLAIAGDLANALAGAPSLSQPGLAVVRAATALELSWNTSVGWAERCVELDAYSPAGRTHLYVAMSEDGNGWALTGLTMSQPDGGPCASD